MLYDLGQKGYLAEPVFPLFEQEYLVRKVVERIKLSKVLNPL